MAARFFFGILALLMIATPFVAEAGAANEKCQDGGVPDNLVRVVGKGYCLGIFTFSPLWVAEGDKPLVVVLHADGRGRATRRDIALARRIAEEFGVTGIAMLRPGYRTPLRTSEGYAKPNDDDYTRDNVAIVADAIRHLRDFYGGRPVVLVGRSGGAAMSALVLALHGDTAKAAVLAGCPCDVPKWRQFRCDTKGRCGTWFSLSPQSLADRVPATAEVIAITGSEDRNTLPEFGRRYIEALKRNGVSAAEFVEAAGATHRSVVESPEFRDAMTRILRGQ